MWEMLSQQRLIDFRDVGVILVNDGEENALPDECFDGYPFWTNQISIPHGGVSRARNAGLDASDADWVMFCDFDDSFMTVYGLYLIFCAMNEGKYDTIWSHFVEETLDREQKLVLVQHDRDWVFIHGKIHRRQYLLDNGIRFNEKLTIHEDCFFNTFAQKCTSEDRVGEIKTQFYIWKWNPESVVRRGGDRDFILDTYDHLIRQRIAVTEEMRKRQMYAEMKATVVKTITDCFYDFQQQTWKELKNAPAVKRAERWVAAYLKRYAEIYAKTDSLTISKVAQASRQAYLARGNFLLESMTMGQWFKHIVQDVRPIPVEEQNV